MIIFQIVLLKIRFYYIPTSISLSVLVNSSSSYSGTSLLKKIGQNTTLF